MLKDSRAHVPGKVANKEVHTEQGSEEAWKGQYIRSMRSVYIYDFCNECSLQMYYLVHPVKGQSS